MAEELGQDRLLNRVDITTPPYSTRYPELLAIYDHEIPVVTKPVRNYVVNGDYSQFKNVYKLDFRLKKNSSVYNDIPGFKPIPFKKMGLYSDGWRL